MQTWFRRADGQRDEAKKTMNKPTFTESVTEWSKFGKLGSSFA